MRNEELSEDDKAYNSQRLPQVPDTPAARGGASSETIIELMVSKEVVVSSTPCVKLHPLAVDLTGVSSPETSEKDIKSKVEMPVGHYQPQLKGFEVRARPKTVLPLSKFRQEKSTVAHNLQLAAEEFKKIREPKISKLKGGYSINVMLVFNSWLKDTEMCVQECRLSNLEAVQLIKFYTSDNARGAVEFYLDTSSIIYYYSINRAPQNVIPDG